MIDDYELPLVRSVLHPTDFSKASEHAFAHALAIALIRKTSLTLLHAGGDRSRSWSSFPSVRRTLERWGMLERGSPRSAVFDQLSVRVKKVVTKKRNPVEACLEYLNDHPTDMIVFATRGRAGALKWIKGSTAEHVSRRSETVSLFVPGKGRGFVSLANGSLNLQRILVPVAHKPSPQPAIQFAARAARIVGGKVEVTLLHVGDAADVPRVTLPDVPGVEWATEVREGDASRQILAAAERISANEIIMTTDGRDVLIDALRGSHTERVIRRASCPVLALPVTWTDEALSGRPIGDLVYEEEQRTNRALKNTFRATARELHPDRASGEDERPSRTDLMARANRAYEEGDIAELKRLRKRSPKRD